MILHWIWGPLPAPERPLMLATVAAYSSAAELERLYAMESMRPMRDD